MACVLLALLIGFNLWASRRVSRHGDALGQRKLLLWIGIWLIPVLGAWIAADHARPPPAWPGPRPPEQPGDASADDAALPHQLDHPDGPPFDLHSHIGLVNGYPLMDWPALAAWAGTAADPEQARRLVEDGRRAWLLHLREVMSPDARLLENEEVFVLSSLEPRVALAMADYVANTRRRITRLLPELADYRSGEKPVVLVLDDEDAYYAYVSIYYPDEGEFAVSGGMFIDAGCPHFVAVYADLSAIEPVIAHEMTHLALAPLSLPRWLDEGIAVNTEHRLTGARARQQSAQQLHQQQQRFWTAQTIQEFWSGSAFLRSDDANTLSYELARILVDQLSRHWLDFAAFVRTAKRHDAGAAAALTVYAATLGAITTSLLELPADPAWEPAAPAD
ncbi:MAG: hypothetical protein RIQ60_2893 [Pseudomonadota bacterium]|jgi:hypothetical protein